MMYERMIFPKTWEEYEKQYGFTDTEQVYTNGARLIPSFRVKQWLCHMESLRRKLAKMQIGRSSYYPNADEDGMVDVSDYPYSK